MLSTIPQMRLLLYIMLAGLIPLICVVFYYFSQEDTLSTLQFDVERVQQLAFNRERKQAINIAVKNHYRDADHFYIDKNLETLTFLEPEIDSLKKIMANPNFPNDENIKKRYETLTGPGNRMSFTEGQVLSGPFFQEVTETMIHPVEVNVADLQEILCRIEGIPIGTCVPPPGRPQLIIIDFKLDKKAVFEKNEVFQLNIKLLKREFL